MAELLVDHYAVECMSESVHSSIGGLPPEFVCAVAKAGARDQFMGYDMRRP
jgi:hypothetical protein